MRGLLPPIDRVERLLSDIFALNLWLNPGPIHWHHAAAEKRAPLGALISIQTSALGLVKRVAF